MSIVDTVKQHPYLVGGGVLLLVVLIAAGRSSPTGQSADNAAAISASLASQDMASRANVAIAGINAGVAKSNNAVYGAMYGAGLNIAADIAKTDQMAQVAAFANFLQSGDTRDAIAANKTTALAGIQSGLKLGGYQRDVAMADINANLSASLNKDANALKMLEVTTTANVAMTDKLIAGDWAKSLLGAGVARDALASQERISLGTVSAQERMYGAGLASKERETSQILNFQSVTLPTLLQHDRNLATMANETQRYTVDKQTATDVRITEIKNQGLLDFTWLSGETERELARIDADTQKYIVTKQTDAARKLSRDSLWQQTIKEVGKGVAAYFASDMRLKENIIRIGTSPRGYGWYEFNFKGDRTKYQGVMAQEVQALDPSAVITRDGFLAVDYSKV